MACFSIKGVKIDGIAAAVPARTEDNETLDLLPGQERQAFIEHTGIRFRRVAPAGMTAADLCMAAAGPLLEKLGWAPDTIDVLVFISQTPDYLIPNTASVIHKRLSLSKNCIAFDINLGCSGYVYGLSVISSLLSLIPESRGLLLVGDCSTSVISPCDKSTWPLFGDAGSATCLSRASGQSMHFNLQTDGTGYSDIMINEGGARNPFSGSSLEMQEIGPGIVRNMLQMKLDGINIFNFSLREAVPNIRKLLEYCGSSLEAVDFLVLHQANKLMLDSIRKKMKLPEARFPLSLYQYGNTSSASVPVTIVSALQQTLSERACNLVLCGFGVGLSWGSAYLSSIQPIVLQMVEC